MADTGTEETEVEVVIVPDREPIPEPLVPAPEPEREPVSARDDDVPARGFDPLSR
jgi:hypothetical protein